MRKRTTLFLFSLLFGTAIIFSCQKEQIQTPAANDISTKSLPACGSTYISATNHIDQTGSVSGLIGHNTKQISYTVYNTLENFVVVLKYDRLPAKSGGSSTVKVTLSGAVSGEDTKTINNGQTVTYIFPLPTGWNRCNEVNWNFVETALDGALALAKSDTYTLFGPIPAGCTLVGNNFSGEVINCEPYREVKYTFTSENGVNNLKIQGGLTAQGGGVPVVILEGFASATSTHRETGNSNYVITVNGNIGACGTATVTVRWTSTNEDPKITGNWSAEFGGEKLEVAPLVCGE